MQPQKKKYNAPTFFFIAHYRAYLLVCKKIMRSPVSFFITVVVIGITIALPTVLYVMLNDFQHIAAKWNNKPTVSIYLKTNTSEKNIQQLVTTLKNNPGIATIKYIPPAQGLADLKQFAEFTDVIPVLKNNPLPPVINIAFTPAVENSPTATALLESLNASPLVDQTIYDLAWVQRIHYVMAIAQRIILTLALLLGIGVVLVISHATHFITHSQQPEIALLKRIGATNNYIRRPFLYQGVMYGVSSGLLAWGLVFSAMRWVSPPILKLLESYHSATLFIGLSIPTGFTILTISTLLCLLGSWLSLLQQPTAV